MGNKNIRLGLHFAALSLAIPTSSVASEPQQFLHLNDVLLATYQYHPKTHIIEADIHKAKAKHEGALGAYDWKLEQRSVARTSGYYDGRYLEQGVSRYLGGLNAKINAGYRISDGEFPVYEAEHETLSSGEANLSLSLSLMRDRDTDKRRFDIARADIEQQQAMSTRTLEMNELLLDAGLTYLKWYQLGHQLQIANSLLELAEKRQEAIRRRVASGDLAEIVALEFEVTLMDRVAAVETARQALMQQNVALSLYFRNDNGEPMDLSVFSVPRKITLRRPDSISEAKLKSFVKQHPIYKQLEQDIQKTKQALLLAKNSHLPQLDLKVNIAEDLGSGSETLDGFESYAGLHFSMPIERRKAKADVNAKKAELRSLNAKLKLQFEELKNQLEIAQKNLLNLAKVERIREDQASLAIKLVDQEQKRFNAGDSNLFLLNSREATSGKAQLEALYAQVNLSRQQLGIMAISAQLEHLASNQLIVQN